MMASSSVPAITGITFEFVAKYGTNYCRTKIIRGYVRLCLVERCKVYPTTERKQLFTPTKGALKINKFEFDITGQM